jgi:hypothetical protein
VEWRSQWREVGAGMNQQDSVGVEGRRGMGVTLSPEKDVL